MGMVVVMAVESGDTRLEISGQKDIINFLDIKSRILLKKLLQFGRQLETKTWFSFS
jgi:hypothetical protein